MLEINSDAWNREKPKSFSFHTKDTWHLLQKPKNQNTRLLSTSLKAIKMECPKTEMKLPNGPEISVVPFSKHRSFKFYKPPPFPELAYIILPYPFIVYFFSSHLFLFPFLPTYKIGLVFMNMCYYPGLWKLTSLCCSTCMLDWKKGHHLMPLILYT